MLTQEKLRVKRFKKSQKRKVIKMFRLKHYGTIFYTPPAKQKKKRKIRINNNKITGVNVSLLDRIINFVYVVLKKVSPRLSF